MIYTNLFTDQKLLRQKGSYVDTRKGIQDSTKRLIDILQERLVLDNNLAAISPQNLFPSSDSNFNHYQRVVLLRNFLGQENYIIINPEVAEVGLGEKEILYGSCASVGINRENENPLCVLQTVPKFIQISGLNMDLVPINSVSDDVELNGYLIHEINHLDGKLITDWAANRDKFTLDYLTSDKGYEWVEPAFLFFTGKLFEIGYVKALNNSSLGRKIPGLSFPQSLFFDFSVEHDISILGKEIETSQGIFPIKIGQYSSL